MAEIKSLYPVFEVPKIQSQQAEETQNYRQSLLFDFSTGDFVRDGANRLVLCDGLEAYRQWCVKVVMTERLTRLAYSPNIGIEGDEALTHGSRDAVQSALERTITEALMVNPRTEYVRGFTFTWTGDQLACRFRVKGRGWEELEIGVNYQEGG